MARKRRVSIGDAADILSSAQQSDKARAVPVELCVLVDALAPRELVETVRDCLVPEFENGRVSVRALAAGVEEQVGLPDACVVVAGAGGTGEDVALALAARGLEVAYVVESVLDADFGALNEQLAGLVHVVAGSDRSAVRERLAGALADALEGKRIALAANFAFCRHAVATRLAKACAMQNAAVGAVDLIPGADLPVMVVSQAKLVLDIAAAYGKPLGLERGLDVAGVLLVALAYRDVARVVLELVPGLAWLVRGGVGYAGTIATGRLMELRLDPPVRELKERVQEVVARSSRLRKVMDEKTAGLGSGGLDLMKMPKNSEV